MQDPPELPPMRSASPAPEPFTMPGPSSSVSRVPLTRRLRQAMTVLAGGGFTIAIAAVSLQLVAKPGLRPTDLMATFEAQTHLGVMNQQLGARPGEMVLTEADYRAKIAEAERSGQAKAELAFQQELAVVQADKERVVMAYQTLFERANIIARAAIELESLAQQFRQRLLEMSNGGRAVVIGLKDVFCGLGSPEACESARMDRGTMVRESDELSRGDVGARIRELMTGIDDPATFITQEDRARHGTPRLTRR